MIKRLRIKFVAIIMTIVTLMLSIIFGLFYASTKKTLETNAISMLRTIATYPRRAERPEGFGGEFTLPYFVLQIDQEGALLSSGGSFYDLSDEDFLLSLVEKAQMQGGEIGVLTEYNLRYFVRGNPRGIVIAFCDMKTEIHVLSSMFRSLLALGILSFLVFLGISILFSYWAVKPVERAWKEQRQFIADASHELKTPLTVIMTNAELLQNPDFDAESQQQFSESILIMAKQMRGLVEKMLELARGDNQEKAIGLSDVDLSRLAEDAALTFEGVFFERGCELSTEITPRLHVRGNPDGLRQVLDILLDNAQKYSAPAGETTVTLTAVHNRCRLCVANPGDPIRPEDLKNIFSRFYRVDTARSRDGSFGLGLPIAQQILAQHHGKIWAESSGGKNSFFVELPLLKTEPQPDSNAVL